MRQVGRHAWMMALLVCGWCAGLQAQQPAASPAPAPPAQRPAKRPPQARTQQEFADYNTAYALAGGAAAEKAADAFAAKYPDSELKVYLYSKVMHEYQSENNPVKLLATGEKVLALDPDNAIALVLTSTVLADSLSDGDQDKEQKIAEIRKNANHAIDTVDSSFEAPANATPEQVAAYKSTLRSMAHSALGIMELKSNDYAAAEKDLRTAADLNTGPPDPYIWYHLGLALDHQSKYAEALSAVNRALQYTESNPDLARLARGEQERLSRLVNAPAAPPTSPQSKPPQQQ